jgi:hypothetical protein
VHEIGHSGDGLRRDVETVDEARVAAWRRRYGDRLLVIDVEGEANRDAAPGGVGDCAGDELRGGLLQVEVVEGEVERPTSRRDELSGVFRDLEGALTPVGQCADVDRQA